MSIDFDPSKQRWRVRWREDGRQRSRRFKSREEAAAFEQRLAVDPPPATSPLPAEPEGGNGIYAYDTKEGVRYRFVFRQSDGTQSNRRGFTSRRAARDRFPARTASRAGRNVAIDGSDLPAYANGQRFRL